MERHRVGIVIPALNESKTIGKVVTFATQYGLPIVVDDGSSDGTDKMAMAAGATVVRHNVNQGYDQALNSGFAHADKMGCEYIITMDADGQHNPAILGIFLNALEEGADVVIGMRDRHQRIAEYIFAWVGKIMWEIRDPLCGMKAYRIGIYRELGHFDSYGSIGTELSIYAAKKNKEIKQLPIATRERVDAPRFGGRYSANKKILRALWLGCKRSLR